MSSTSATSPLPRMVEPGQRLQVAEDAGQRLDHGLVLAQQAVDHQADAHLAVAHDDQAAARARVGLRATP
jgi:hypothetical protein